MFNNSGRIIEHFKSINFNNDDLYGGKIRESLLLEASKEKQKIQLEKANKEFNELNIRNNFNASNIVPEKSKFVIKTLTDGTRNIRTIFFIFIQIFKIFL